jgi:nucleoside-diphosphate-sugar epimerase
VILLTGGTGFLGGYALARLVERTDEPIALLVRARSDADADAKLWRNMQLHWTRQQLEAHRKRIRYVSGDLNEDRLGVDPGTWESVARDVTSICHVAASLNRKSEKACLNTNLRGTLSMIQLARGAVDRGGLRRFTHVSTVAVCGKRWKELVQEDESIDWSRSDYDPYGRTKKFAEHMVTTLLPDVQRVFLRPSIVMGDSRFPQTTQFDMVRAFCELAQMPVVPLKGDTRLDIVNADWVGEAIATLHLEQKPKFERYHLSSGTQARTAGDIASALSGTKMRLRFAPRLGRPFEWGVRAMNRLPRGNPLQPLGAAMKVFWPYIVYDTVFDNRRAVEAVGRAPTPFPEYCAGLFEWATEHRYTYPHTEWSRA